MEPRVAMLRPTLADVVFGLLDPIPYGCFAAALVFDVIYQRSTQVAWTKGAAWLIVFGLLAAIVPRLVNLVQVWVTRRRAARGERIAFWLNLLAVVAAIFNAFVHSRDAWAVVPAGLWLSILTVVLLALAQVARILDGARAP